VVEVGEYEEELVRSSEVVVVGCRVVVFSAIVTMVRLCGFGYIRELFLV
jgi:hypothetical protein